MQKLTMSLPVKFCLFQTVTEAHIWTDRHLFVQFIVSLRRQRCSTMHYTQYEGVRAILSASTTISDGASWRR